MPQQGSQQVVQQIPLQAVQPAERVAQQPAAQPEHHQAATGQAVSAQQPVNQSQPAHPPQLSPENGGVAGVKRGPTSEPQAGPALAKKAKVFAPVATHAPSPSTQPQSEKAPETICTINYEDAGLLAEARDRPEATWPGVPNLVIGAEPVKLQKGTPTKRYVVLSTKGGKDPLFPSLWRGWTPAESLGNHADAYQKATSDLDRQRADIRLEIEMRRGQTGEWQPCQHEWFRVVANPRIPRNPGRLVEEGDQGRSGELFVFCSAIPRACLLTPILPA